MPFESGLVDLVTREQHLSIATLYPVAESSFEVWTARVGDIAEREVRVRHRYAIVVEAHHLTLDRSPMRPPAFGDRPVVAEETLRHVHRALSAVGRHLHPAIAYVGLHGPSVGVLHRRDAHVTVTISAWVNGTKSLGEEGRGLSQGVHHHETSPFLHDRIAVRILAAQREGSNFEHVHRCTLKHDLVQDRLQIVLNDARGYQVRKRMEGKRAGRIALHLPVPIAGE